MSRSKASDWRWLDAVVETFEVAWQMSQKPTIEQYVFEVTGQRRRVLLRELAITEIEIRAKLGDSVTR